MIAELVKLQNHDAFFIGVEHGLELCPPHAIFKFIRGTGIYFLGKGIVNPIDDVRVSNPPSNPELLNALGAKLMEYDFDVRKLAIDIQLGYFGLGLSRVSQSPENI